MKEEMKLADFSELKESVINKIECSKKHECAKIIFHTNNGIYKFDSDSDCCARIYLEDIVGDIKDVLNSPILLAEKVETNESNSKGLPEWLDHTMYDTQIWCFYKLATIKGYVTFRFLEHNNGYYSISLDFYKDE